MLADLIKVGLIGTDKCTPSVSTLEKLQEWGINSADLTESVLQGIGIFSLMRKGGFPLKDSSIELPIPCEREVENVLSPQSVRHLREIIKGKMGETLLEFAYFTRLYKKILPAEFLPTIFNACRNDNFLWSMVKPIMGKRGEWLIKQNPEWEHLLQKDVLTKDVLPPQYSDTQTLELAQEIAQLLKNNTLIWTGDKDLIEKLKNLAYNGNTNVLSNIDLLLNFDSYHSFSQKVQDTLKILFFRKEMINHLKGV